MIDIKFVGKRLDAHLKGKLNVVFKNFEFYCSTHGCTDGEVDLSLDYGYDGIFDDTLTQYIELLFEEYNLGGKMTGWSINFAENELVDIERRLW